MPGNAIMKVVELGRPFGIEGLQVAERELPEPSMGQILIRMRAAALNFRDLMFVRDQYLTPIRPGLIPLCDGAGEVVGTGTGVTRFREGDKAVPIFYQGWIGGSNPPDPDSDIGRGRDGTLAEYMVVDEQDAVALPDHLSFREGAALTCAGLTAWTALFNKTQLLPGAQVLIQGTGGVSLFSLQFAKAAGLRVIATTSTAEKAALLRSMGADEVINYVESPAWGDAVLDASGGRGVDLVVDVSGGQTIDQSVRASRRGGAIALVGILGDVFTGTFGGPKIADLLMGQVRTLPVGVGNRDDFEAMNRAIALHKIRPVIDKKEFGLEEHQDAFRHMEAQKHTGKVVIDIL